MAGELAGFDPDAFRTAITNTMVMGLPSDPADQPTFYFRESLSYPPGTTLDSTGKPIDPRIAPTATASAPVQVPCAVEFTPDQNPNEGLVGSFWATKAVLTLLDTHYAQVSDAIEVDLGGRRYLISYDEPPVGLGPVTVHRLHCFPKGVNPTS